MSQDTLIWASKDTDMSLPTFVLLSMEKYYVLNVVPLSQMMTQAGQYSVSSALIIVAPKD
jgi:hypothetical protein